VCDGRNGISAEISLKHSRDDDIVGRRADENVGDGGGTAAALLYRVSQFLAYILHGGDVEEGSSVGSATVDVSSEVELL